MSRRELGKCKKCGKELYEVSLKGVDIKEIYQRNAMGSSPHEDCGVGK